MYNWYGLNRLGDFGNDHAVSHGDLTLKKK